MDDRSAPVRAIRMGRSKDGLHTLILACGFISSIFLPTYLLQLLSALPADFQNRVIAHKHWIEAISMVLAVWLAMIALRFATHLEIRQRNSSRQITGPIELIIIAGTAYVSYKYLSDQMMDGIKEFWSPNADTMSLNRIMQIWIIWWSILLGYIAKVPWDRAKQLIQQPAAKGNGEAPIIAGRWSLAYCVAMILILLGQTSYYTAFPPVDSTIVRATTVRQIADHECLPAIRGLKALTADGKVTDEEKDVAITIISNARATYGLLKCSFNPKALR